MYLKNQGDLFKQYEYKSISSFIPLNAELYPISHLLALLGAHPIFHVSRIRFKIRVLVTFTTYSYENFRYKLDIIVHVSRPAGVDLT